ncbi:unnamed protein product [Lathyrus sativus]|nr:unnamed protein product [Lathyrus sativus]
MLGKRSQHLIRKFSELLVFGETATALLDTIGSPRSPFEMNSRMQIQSPKFGGGVGLGIVVALDKSEETGYEVVPKQHVCTSPIPIKHQQNRLFENAIFVGSPEDYTYVTYRDESNKPITKVFYDGGEESRILRHDYYYNDNNNTSNKNHINKNVGVFRRSPPTQTFLEAEPSFLTLDFLHSCHLCKMNLDGKDIFMYRGEKGFCSTECRSKQIMMDERKEKCRSEASKSRMELSSSSYTKDQMFSTGIMAL